MNLIWLNGEVRPDAQLSALSAGTLLGLGVFSTLGVWHHHAFALERHLQRLRHDATRLELPIAYDDATIEGALTQVLRANAIENGLARLTITARGDGRWNLDASSDFSIAALPRNHEAGDARLMLSPFRVDSRRPTSGLKVTSYGDWLLMWRAAQAQGFDEAVVCNSQGAVCEATRANLFWTRGGELFTPSLETGCLPGIARALVLEWCAEMGIAARQGFFAPLELELADEVFLTASSTGPRVVREFCDGPQITLYKGGEITQTLERRWKEAVRQSAA